MTIACPRFQDSFMRRCRYHAVTMTQQLQQRRKPERIAPFQSMGI
jgi:hypothetical protein